MKPNVLHRGLVDTKILLRVVEGMLNCVARIVQDLYLMEAEEMDEQLLESGQRLADVGNRNSMLVVALEFVEDDFVGYPLKMVCQDLSHCALIQPIFCVRDLI